MVRIKVAAAFKRMIWRRLTVDMIDISAYSMSAGLKLTWELLVSPKIANKPELEYMRMLR